MMYKSQFQKSDPYDWFCAPGSQMWKGFFAVILNLGGIFVHFGGILAPSPR